MKKHYGTGHIGRLKERFLEGKTTKPELLELMFSYVIKGRDVKPQAKDAYKLCGGNFREVFAPVISGKVEGAGRESAVFFRVLKEFIDVYNSEKFMGSRYSVRSQSDVVEYFRSLTHGADKESVHALFLDAKNRIIKNTKVTEGTVTQSVLYPREIVKQAMDAAAVGVIVVHNHPSGDPGPSQSDRSITEKLRNALKGMDISLLDHIIVGANGYFSFHEQGMLEG